MTLIIVIHCILITVVFYGNKTENPHPVCQYFNPIEYRPLTMDDMPVPICSWKEYYAKRNRKYNAVFAFGLISLIGSIFCVSTSMRILEK